jgi:hypothetical protein
MSNVLTKPLPKGCLIFGVLLPFVILIVLYAGATGDMVLIEIPFRIIGGWASHAVETLPPFFAKWRAAVFPVGCLVIAVWLTHSFVRRWAKAKRPDLTWRFKYTVSIYSLLFLTSAAAIAMSGIVHQFFWLSKEPVIEHRGASERASIGLQTRNLSQAVQAIVNMNGRYPSSLDEVNEFMEMESLSWCFNKRNEVPEPFILLQPRSIDKLEDDDLIIVSPLVTSLNKHAVCYANSFPIWISPEELRDLMKKSQARKNSNEDD